MEKVRRLKESDTATFHVVLAEALHVLDRSGLAHVLIGGVAASALGIGRSTHDIDVLIRPEDRDDVLGELARAGFRTERTDPTWLYKAFKSDVMVDLIFMTSGPVFLDEEMLAHARVVRFYGRPVRTVAPEDLIVIKCLVLNESALFLALGKKGRGFDGHGLRHLHDILSVVRQNDLDADYLLQRSRFGPRRVLAILLYAQSIDVPVPERAIEGLSRSLRLCGPGDRSGLVDADWP